MLSFARLSNYYPSSLTTIESNTLNTANLTANFFISRTKARDVIHAAEKTNGNENGYKFKDFGSHNAEGNRWAVISQTPLESTQSTHHMPLADAMIQSEAAKSTSPTASAS